MCKVDVVHEGRSKVIGTMLLPTSMDNWLAPVDGYLDVILTEQPITDHHDARPVLCLSLRANLMHDADGGPRSPVSKDSELACRITQTI